MSKSTRLFFFLLSATWASKKPKKMNVVDDDLDWDGGEVDFSLRAWMGEGEGEWTLTREATFFFLYLQVTACSAGFSEADMGCCLICSPPTVCSCKKKKKASMNIQPDMLSCFFFLTHFMWISAVIYHFFFSFFRFFCFLALSFEKRTRVLTALWENENFYRRACKPAAGGYLPFRPFIQKLGVVGEAVKRIQHREKKKSTSRFFFFSHP